MGKGGKGFHKKGFLSELSMETPTEKKKTLRSHHKGSRKFKARASKEVSPA